MRLTTESAIGIGIGFGVVLVGAVAAAALGEQQTRGLDVNRLMRAFAAVESGGRSQVRGDGGASWGLYQFGRDRWRECGGRGDDWGRAPARRQHVIMRLAIREYMATMPSGLSIEQRVCWIGRCHNGGKRTGAHNAYTRRLWAEYTSGA